jgi:histidyl-tRNA synthetase
VFEISGGEGIGSIAGGGRYDNLIELYGSKATPATGISLGIERLMELMKERGRKAVTKAFVAAAQEEYKKEARVVVAKLRAAGVPAQVDLMNRKLGKQLEYAHSQGIAFAVIIGEREKKEGKVTLRDMKSGKEKQLKLEDAIKELS